MLRKLVEYWWLPLAAPIIVFVVILIRLLKPFVIVRFFEFKTWSMGCFAQYPEMYLCHLELDDQSKYFDVLFADTRKVANYQLLKMWLRIFPQTHLRFCRFLKCIVRLNHIIPGGRQHRFINY